MIVILGDIHFRDDKEYWINICNNFLNWFKNWKLNSNENDLILAGDLVDNTLSLSGKVIDYIEKFASYSNFRSIHICVGNHDKKKINGRDQLSYEFLKNKTGVFIYEEATEVSINNKNVLILPHFSGINKYNLTIHDYYSNIYNNDKFTNNYDIVVGHFCGEDQIFPDDNGYVENLDKLNSKHVILGHVHTRNINPQRYIGSVFACKKSENDYTRSAIIIDNDGNRTEEVLPLFNEFLTVSYPDELPKSSAEVPIYTILNCATEVAALSNYGDISIKKVTSNVVDKTGKSKVSLERKLELVKNFDISEIFESFCKENSQLITKDIKNDCITLLKKFN